MKKVILVAAVGMLALASCKKDYICECTTSGAGTDLTSSVTIPNSSKSDAEAACNGSESSFFGITTTCELK